jgi:putative transposase
MPNHFHLLLRQHGDAGIPQFMQKLSTAYTMYFNTKQERVGSLFQGPYKAIHIKSEEYLTHLSRYIHLNPLDLKYSEWREQGIRNPSQAQRFLQHYSWSSYHDYLGSNTHPYLLDTTLLKEIIGPSKDYAQFVEEWAGIEYLDEVSPLVNEA